MTLYTTGTVTLTNGSAAVTGTGTGWQTAVIAGGVIYPAAEGNALPVASVDSDTTITAAVTWQGATGTYAYALARQDDTQQVIANAVALADYIQRLNNPALASIAGLTPAADRLAYFTGTSAAGLATLTGFARSLLDDADASAALTTLGVSAFARTLLDDGDAATALATLGALATSGGTLTGTLETRNLIAKTGTATPAGGRYYSYAYDDPTKRAFFCGSQPSGARPNATIGVENDSEGVSAYLIFTCDGDFSVPGSITGAAKNFRIDHPVIDGKSLVFASTESPHNGIEAWGTATLVDGQATVDIDAACGLTSGTWAALAQNTIVVSLVNQDGFARIRPAKTDENVFEIISEDDTATDTITWLVKADRADAAVKALNYCDPATGLLIPEQDKPSETSEGVA
ncbi:hypothetical protein [Martelella sp. HB161492]|uniref:hypothetical protein n=1 Tax=Martelella sp. HB161492 TaxID=2720726 RepID=UPI0015920777|nr:hypothetical protein [Martelella sp. HB161492]